MCILAQVSRAGYYRRWQTVAPRTAETALRDEVQRLALAERHYGHRRITALLRRSGWRVNRKRVLRLMREDNLLCLRKKAFVPATTDSRHSWRIYPNPAWRLQPSEVNQLWVADITYVRLAEGFAYLAMVLDAFSRRAIGWAMEEHLKAVWHWRRSTWHWRAGRSRRDCWCTIPIAACSTPVAIMSTGSRRTASSRA